MSDMTCITSFLETSSFPVSLVTTISYTYFICLSNGNPFCLRRNSSLYVIGLLPIFCKQLDTGIWGTGYLPNSKSSSLHTTSTIGFLIISRYFFILGQFSSLHQNFLFCFAVGSSLFLVTVTVFCSYELSYPDSMGINSIKPTTNFAHTVTLICFLLSSCLAFFCCVLMTPPSPSSSWILLDIACSKRERRGRTKFFRRRTTRWKRT